MLNPENSALAQIGARADSSLIDSLNQISLSIINQPQDGEKLKSSRKLLNNISEILHRTSNELPSFGAIEGLSYLHSPDSSVHLFTWAIPLSDGTFEFSGVVSYHHDLEPGLVYELNDASALGGNFPFAELNTEEWFGAVYYELIEMSDSTNQFTLIGWKGNDKVTAKKVIDVLTFDENLKPSFGAPIFIIHPDSVLYRCVFEFSAEVVMSIKYTPEQNIILLDHLFPSHPSLMGHYEFYGPDLSFDAFEWEGKTWLFREDFDPGNRPNEKPIKLPKSRDIYKP